MLETITAAGGGGSLLTVIVVAAVYILVRPKILTTLTALAVAPFRGSRWYSRVLEILAIVHGVQPGEREEAQKDD
ncbi:hypothetical protein [Arthrobacter crystallopoietes]|uniref:hypothetical protein n=1 Tax=Crystallibacter crystallopoietes TaxID=37928 RepID=UPI0011111A0B|nr:hypothetical protein [Arthrobacter crystallopoietes]